VKFRALVLFAAAASSLLAAVLAPAAARAGTYTISVSTAKDTTGWSFAHAPGFFGCSYRLHPGPCAGVPSPGPLRILAYGQAAKLSNAWWQW